MPFRLVPVHHATAEAGIDLPVHRTAHITAHPDAGCTQTGQDGIEALLRHPEAEMLDRKRRIRLDEVAESSLKCNVLS
ncbi:MAG: hypothetical protein RIQ60_4505 [Pseudomonadota bacterium]